MINSRRPRISSSRKMGALLAPLVMLLLLPAVVDAVLPIGEIRFKSTPGYTHCSMAVRANLDRFGLDWIGLGRMKGRGFAPRATGELMHMKLTAPTITNKRHRRSAPSCPASPTRPSCCWWSHWPAARRRSGARATAATRS
jgi:hypothetical protein